MSASSQELLTQLNAEWKQHLGTHSETISKLTDRINALEVAAGKPPSGDSVFRSLASDVWDTPEFKDLARRGKGSICLPFDGRELKTLISSTAVGSGTSGVLMPQRVPGVTTEARRQLGLLDLLRVYPTSANAVDFVKISSFSKVVSPQTEASAKGESEMRFTTSSANVQTIATWIPATKQVLDDFSALRVAIEEGLTFALKEEIEDQILSGSGAGTNLNGLVTQATAFDTSLLVVADGWEKADIVMRARQQLAAANEVTPDFVVLHPTDYYGMRAIKDTTGRYIFDRPDGETQFNPIWGLTPIITTGMTAGYFLVGSSQPRAAAVFQRQGVTVDISTEHSTYFTENKVAIRVEARLTLVVFRPAAYIYGALNTSPA